jgi:hypothetical protein
MALRSRDDGHLPAHPPVTAEAFGISQEWSCRMRCMTLSPRRSSCASAATGRRS